MENINRYLNHSSAVAKKNYVIESHQAMVETKQLIKKHKFRNEREHDLVTIAVDTKESESALSDSGESVQSIKYTGPKDAIFHYQKPQLPIVSKAPLNEMIFQKWPVHPLCRVPTPLTIIEKIVSPNPASGPYHLSQNNGPTKAMFTLGVSEPGIAYRIHSDYRKARVHARV